MACINANLLNQDSRDEALTGMRIQGVTTLSPGTPLHRFVARSVAGPAIASPWWFQTPSIRQILIAARDGHRGDVSVASQAHKMAGLSKTWAGTGADYLVTARVVSELRVFWGIPIPIGIAKSGKQIATGLKSYSSIVDGGIEGVPDPRCVQFFVPGMRDERLRASAIRFVSQTPFDGDPDLESGNVEYFLHRIAGN